MTRHSLSYVITASARHVVAAQMCIETLRQVSDSPIVVVGTLDPGQAGAIRSQRT
jgi:hypothetical protein